MAVAVAERSVSNMNRKIVSISGKRQITIPQKFFQMLEFGNEAEFILRDNELVIRPVKTVSGGEFAEQILEELVAEGLSGTELITRFKERQKQIRPAVEKMLSVAEDAAVGIGEYDSYDDIFGTED